jgi:hypothetical protein
MVPALRSAGYPSFGGLAGYGPMTPWPGVATLYTPDHLITKGPPPSSPWPRR